jgi:hypothetical protein
VTTSTAHGFAIGDVVEIAGTSSVSAHGKWVVHAIPTTTTFIIVQTELSGTTGGTAKVMLNCVNVLRGGETSELTRVHTSKAFNSGIYYGVRGTPFRMIGCASFENNDFGFDLWADRPLYLEGPSGDANGKGLINIEGPSGSSYGQATVTIVSLKSEFQTVPIITFKNWIGSALIIGGSAEMGTGNTAPAFRRIGPGGSTIDIRGMRIDMRQAGTVFDDQSTAAQSRSTTHVYAFTYSDYIGAATQKDYERWIYMGGTTPTPFIDNAQNFRLTIDANNTTLTVQPPTSYSPAFNQTTETITILIQNTTTGVATVNWASAYRLPAFTAPAAGKFKAVTFKRFGSTWYMVGETPDM